MGQVWEKRLLAVNDTSQTTLSGLKVTWWIKDLYYVPNKLYTGRNESKMWRQMSRRRFAENNHHTIGMSWENRVNHDMLSLCWGRSLSAGTLTSGQRGWLHILVFRAGTLTMTLYGWVRYTRTDVISDVKKQHMIHVKTYEESLPCGQNANFPKPKPPSLGWPRSLTPHPLMTSSQLRTTSSSFFATKSKKLRLSADVVGTNLSFVTYMIVQLTVKRSRIRAVRIDCFGRGSKVIASLGGRLDCSTGDSSEGDNERGLSSGLGGMGDLSAQRWLREGHLTCSGPGKTHPEFETLSCWRNDFYLLCRWGIMQSFRSGSGKWYTAYQDVVDDRSWLRALSDTG